MKRPLSSSSRTDYIAAVFVKSRAELRNMMLKLRRMAPGQLKLWLVAALIGVVVAMACHVFITLVSAISRALYRAETDNLLYWVYALPWWWIVLIPTMGGFLTAIILKYGTNDGKARSISHVIEAAALKNGRLDEGGGWASTSASIISLSMGGSAGQEGPLVHMGGVIATRFSKWLQADAMTARDFLACAAASAVATSFNAPLAGILFAFEIVLRHYSISATTPIAIAATAGTVLGHYLRGGDFAEVEFFQLAVTQYSEIPAFVLLGLLCGIVATIFVRAIFFADDLANGIEKRFAMRFWVRPTMAGFLLGVIAIWFPHIIGVGHVTTVKALYGNLLFSEVIVLVTIKVIAVAITMGGRMAGGIFSPCLMIGAMTGLAFGLVATNFGNDVGHEQLYALAGMAAISAAVLGAPLSTALIILEMTRDWQAALPVVSTVVIASGISNKLLDKSFFLTQLERRGLHIAAGPQVYLQAMFKVSSYAKPLALTPAQIAEHIERGAFVFSDESFEEAMPKFEELNVTNLVVYMGSRDQDGAKIMGQLDYLDVLRIYSHALADTSAEEHD